jgi:putative photosynthetic complex assembly protein
MAHPASNRTLGQLPVLALAALLAFVLGAVALNGPAPREAGLRPAPVESRELRFADTPDGGVAVTDARSGAPIATLAPGTGGFVRGAMRGLARDRRRDGGGPEAPFLLATWPDGSFTLEDTVTGHAIDLRAFGRTQTETFANILHAPEGTP